MKKPNVRLLFLLSSVVSVMHPAIALAMMTAGKPGASGWFY